MEIPQYLDPTSNQPTIQRQYRSNNAKAQLAGFEEGAIRGDAAFVGTARSSEVPAATTDRLGGQQRNATQPSSTTSTTHPTRTESQSYDPAFLPTPPPEPHSSLPQCTEFDFHEFERRNVYPYGVETPGLIQTPDGDYFGR